METLKKKFAQLIDTYGSKGLRSRLYTFDICADYGVELEGSTIDAITKERSTIILYYNENTSDWDDITAFDKENLETFFNELSERLSARSNIVEGWWRHNGAYDRSRACSFKWNKEKQDISDYMDLTDKWWSSLSLGEKQAIYNEFFSEE